jgi:hypothetical protein
MQVTLVQCYLRLMGEKLWKSQVFRVAGTVQIEIEYRNHKERKFSSLSSMSRVLITLNSFHKASQPS